MNRTASLALCLCLPALAHAQDTYTYQRPKLQPGQVLTVTASETSTDYGALEGGTVITDLRKSKELRYTLRILEVNATGRVKRVEVTYEGGTLTAKGQKGRRQLDESVTPAYVNKPVIVSVDDSDRLSYAVSVRRNALRPAAGRARG